MFAGAKLKRNFENARLLVIFDILNFSGIKSNNNIVCRMSIDNNLIYKLDNIERVEIDTLRKSLKAIGLIGKS
ncbi:hypothetical protein I180019D1_06480 [Alistipes sp. i18-0019-D1]